MRRNDHDTKSEALMLGYNSNKLTLRYLREMSGFRPLAVLFSASAASYAQSLMN
jgi:hypothetical protein